MALNLFHAVVAVEYEATVFSSSEGGPVIQICLNLVDGFVGPSGVTVRVESVGGTATGKGGSVSPACVEKAKKLSLFAWVSHKSWLITSLSMSTVPYPSPPSLLISSSLPPSLPSLPPSSLQSYSR